MKALWFLWSRQVINGIKRATQSPKRLISMLLGLGYFVGVFIRPWDSSTKGLGKLTQGMQRIDATQLSVGVFLIFMLLSMVLSLSVFGFKNTFKPADVDVLFPTPISTRVVMFFRLFRDYSGTVLFPFFIALVSYRPTQGFFQSWQKGDAAGMNNALRGAFLSWVVLSLAWVAFSYALSFYVAKKEPKGDVIARIAGWTLAAGVVVVLAIYSFSMRARPEWSTIIAVSNSLPVKAIMFIPYAAMNMAMGGYNGAPFQSLGGLLVLLVPIVGCTVFAARNSDWMYDQAATRGFQSQTLRTMMQKGDTSGMYAEKARMGKLKQGRIAARLSKMTLKGGWALLYKELLIQSRTGIWTNIFMALMVTAFAIMFSMLPTTTKSGRSIVDIAPLIYLGVVGFMSANMSMATAYNGFTETLRRVEVIKPLALNSRQIAFYETLSKSVFAITIVLVPFIAGFIAKPIWWQYHIAGLIASSSLAVALVSMVFLVVVLFPDFDDITQRSFRGFMQLIGMVLVFTPTMLLFAGSYLLKTGPIVPALLCVGVNAGITLLLATLAGRFYADFNPSE